MKNESRSWHFQGMKSGVCNPVNGYQSSGRPAMGASASAGLQNSFVAQSSPSLLSPQYSHRGTRYCLPSSTASPLCIRVCIVSLKITFCLSSQHIASLKITFSLSSQHIGSLKITFCLSSQHIGSPKITFCLSSQHIGSPKITFCLSSQHISSPKITFHPLSRGLCTPFILPIYIPWFNCLAMGRSLFMMIREHHTSVAQTIGYPHLASWHEQDIL